MESIAAHGLFNIPCEEVHDRSYIDIFKLDVAEDEDTLSENASSTIRTGVFSIRLNFDDMARLKEIGGRPWIAKHIKEVVIHVGDLNWDTLDRNIESSYEDSAFSDSYSLQHLRTTKDIARRGVSRLRKEFIKRSGQ
jgi:hypothetical protein